MLAAGSSFTFYTHDGYDGNRPYPSYSDTIWYLEAEDGNRLIIHFVHFETETHHDWMDVYDGDEKVTRISGQAVRVNYSINTR